MYRYLWGGLVYLTTFDDIKYKINMNLDHNLKYAEERNKLVENLLNENDWIVDLLSKEDVRRKQIKTRDDPLSENQAPDILLEQIADYILYPKFVNKNEEEYYNYLKKYEQQLNKKIHKFKKVKTDKRKYLEEINEIKLEAKEIENKLNSFKKKYLSESMKNKNKHREMLFDYVDKIEEKIGIIVDDSNLNKNKYKQFTFNIEVNDEYWDKMNFSEYNKTFRKEILDIYETTIDNLRRQIGLHIKDKNVRNEYISNLIHKYDKEKIVYVFNNRETVISGTDRYFKLRKMYGELVSDYNKVKELLTVPISFQSPTTTSTKYDFNTDTWYIDEDGSVVEVSKNLLLFSDPNTYKGLILNYSDLVDAYEDKFNDDMWAILRTFESILKKTGLSDEEELVVFELMMGKARHEVINKYLDIFNKDLSDKVLSTWINKTIPSKLVDTYLESVNEWLYTYKIKGKYKKCSSCGEIKTINNDRYFGRDIRNKDGFKSICKKCDNYTKNGKK